MQLDRSKYSEKTLAICETIGNYFVDRFYNFIYAKSKNLVNEGRFKSLTEAYRSTIFNYMEGVKGDEWYTSVVMNLHKYYQNQIGMSPVLMEFEDTMLREFIPPKYYCNFTNPQKDKVMKDIITRLVTDFGTLVIGRKMLPKIIDDHTNQKNVSMLQDATMDILLTMRDDYYVQFANEVSESVGGGKVSKQMVTKLKTALIEEKKSKCAAIEDRELAINMVKQLVNKIHEISSHNEKLIAENDKLIKENERLREQKTIRIEKKPEQIAEKPKSVLSQMKPSDSSSEEIDEEELQKQRREKLSKITPVAKNKPEPEPETKQDPDYDVWGL